MEDFMPDESTFILIPNVRGLVKHLPFLAKKC